jgi:indole-3-glycerol phosphate synthase
MSVLEEIVAGKRAEIDRLKTESDSSGFRTRAFRAQPCRDLVEALKSCRHVPVIAEIKRASPSAGTLREVEDVASLAASYEQAGATALSVLTDGPFFGGSMRDLKEARASVNIPILRKDFLLDPVQLYESRIAGADAVLLIVAALEPNQLRSLFHETLALGMTPVVEIHDERELACALELQPPVIGINNRDLSTLEVNLDTCMRLRPSIPSEILVVGESGIRETDDIERLCGIGVDAFLIGTTLMRSPDPADVLKRLCQARS